MRARSQALREKGRAILHDRSPRLFEAAPSALTPGGALRLTPPPDTAAEAARRLAELARAAARDGQAPTWIAVEPESWDPVSRRAFESARLALRDALEVVVVSFGGSPPAPASPADWRRAVWVPCGSLAGAVRFYEWIAARGAPAPRTLALVRRIVRDPAWAAFASDPTGDAALPETPELFGPVASAAPPSPSFAPSYPSKSRPEAADPGSRIERLLAEGQLSSAMRDAELWVRAFPGRPPEAWFPLAARLAACGQPLPAWLETIEAERELAAGRAGEARARLERVIRAPGTEAGERRRAQLRIAEILAQLDQPAEAGRRAAQWRSLHPEAPAPEVVRALRIGAAAFSREGRVDCALALLDEAERAGGTLEEVETALARARVFARAGRFAEEAAVYGGARALALGAGDDRLAARFLAQEARGLLDRRDHAGAMVRLEEALAACRGQPSERAELLLDLAAARYHAGGEAESEATLSEALAAAAAAGREDLVRIARGNRIELLVNRGAWDEASTEIAALAERARAEKDATRLLVALHHRGRLALRRGFLEDAARDNREARRLADEVGDRLEIGELWVEEGDRLLYAGDASGAREAWERAASVPADRCERAGIARERLAEAGWRAAGGPPADALEALGPRWANDAYGAAETVARWRQLFGENGVAQPLRERAASALQSSGGAELAARVFGRPAAAPPPEALRPLRAALSAGLAGEAPHLDGALSRLGVAGLCVRDSAGRPVVALGAAVPDGALWRPIEAGAARFEVALWPPPAAETGVAPAVAVLLETLLFRAEAPGETSDVPRAAAGWRRLHIVTGDASMEEPYRRLERFAPQAVTVLVLGESGSGKEAAARAIHRLSPRAAGPFVGVNVAAIPGGVVESELFGHARGAFSGADRERRGLLEEAGGGTIFFDEIGDLEPSLQSKLLRALQERELRRVGENRSRPIDVRVVSATARDLAREVEAGRFREDLFYRLHVAVIRLPPLRERGRDALLLARHFLEQYGREYGRGGLRLAPESAAAIAAHSWPGNVRELQNAMAQAAALCDAGGVVTPGLLPEGMRPRRVSPAPPAPARSGDYRARVDAHRRGLIADALDRAGGNRSRAARELGLSRQALLYLIRELKVEPRAR